MDEFTFQRITRLIDAYKHAHGRDIAEAELTAQGVAAKDLDSLVRKGMVDKYQVTTGTGSLENRFKLHRDWRTLRTT